MKFTKEEISLCKQVAEKHRKEIKYGDWSLNEGGFVKVWPYRHNCKRIELIPLWTISDCLEFLYQKEVPLEIETRYDPWAVKRGWRWHMWWGEPKDNVKPWGGSINAKTLLEACLKAVLAVLEEKK